MVRVAHLDVGKKFKVMSKRSKITIRSTTVEVDEGLREIRMEPLHDTAIKRAKVAAVQNKDQPSAVDTFDSDTRHQAKADNCAK